MKFILEITENGFQEYEFLSRMMTYKKDPELVIAYMKCLKPVSNFAGMELMKLSKWLKGKNWKKIFANED